MNEIPPEITRYTDESQSRIHHALRASRRRLLVALLAYRTLIPAESSISTDEPVSVRQLAREIVVLEEDVEFAHATGAPYHNVYSSLIQTHLPELHDIGVVQYDSDRKTVSAAPNLAAVAMVAAITSPTARLLFHSAVTKLDNEDESVLNDSITD